MSTNSQASGDGAVFSQHVTLDQIANADRIRFGQNFQHKQNTRQRRGNKGARQWGFMQPGSGKRKGR